MNLQERPSPDLDVVEQLHDRTRARGAAEPNAQQWLRARDARLAATWEHVGAGIVEVDSDGRMLRVNQKICELTGYSAGEMLGRTIFDMTVAEDAEEDRAQLARQRDG